MKIGWLNLEWVGWLKDRVVAFTAFLIDHPMSTLTVYAVLAVSAVAVTTQLKFDTSTDVFFDQSTEIFIHSKQLDKQFGRGEFCVVALTVPDIFTEKSLKLVAHLTERFKQLKYVDKVTSLTTVNDILGENDNFIVEPLVKEIPSDPAKLATLRQRAMGNPLYIKNVISADGKTAGILVEIEDIPSLRGAHRQGVVLAVQEILRTDIPPDVTAYLSGGAAMEYHYNTFLEQDMAKFVPLAILMMAAILWFTFRRLRLMIYPMIIVSLGLIFTLAFMHLVGFKINSVTSIIPPCMLAMTVAESVHYVTHIVRSRDMERRRLLIEKMNELAVPFFMTSATTVVGFLSLLTTQSPAIRQLGIVGSVGVTITIIVTFTLLPVLMKWGKFSLRESAAIDAQERKVDLWVAPIVEFIIRLINRRRKAMVWGSVALSVLCVAGACRIKSESSLLAQMGEGAPIVRSTRYVESHLSGTHVAYVSLHHERADGFKDPVSLRLIEKLQAFLKTIPEMDKSMSVVDLLKDMNQSFHNEDSAFYRVPDTREMVAQYTLLYSGDDLADYVDSTWSWAIIPFRMNEHSSRRLEEIFKQIRQFLSENSRAGIRMEVLGPSVWEAEGANTVTMGQFWNLSTGMLATFLMMFLCFRSFGVGLVSTVPNVLPLLINFGIMGFFGIRLDTATSIIAAVAIGIIVDNTIHFIYGFGEAMEKDKDDYAKAVFHSLRSRGAAMVSTSVVLSLSFGILMTSRFVPVFQFGLLSAVLMVTALFADLVLNPCLLIWLRPKVAKMV